MIQRAFLKWDLHASFSAQTPYNTWQQHYSVIYCLYRKELWDENYYKPFFNDTVKALIRNGKLKENDNLPSVRSLAKELKISALTVKKAYDNLENEGFTVTIHGKGTYVTATNTELLLEEQKKELESDLERIIQKGRCYGISDEDIKKLFELILEG